MRKRLRICLIVTVCCFIAGSLSAQDPNFSQFISSPLSVSPALTANTEASWRIMSNIRRQSTGIGSPYTTKTLSVERKLVNSYNDNYWGIGGMVMLDAAMDGIYKSTYISLNAAYHLALDENGNGLAAGLGYINNRTMISFADLTFDQQLSSMGFNRALPQGEPSLSNSPSFSSVCAGVMYTYAIDNTFANLGVAGYRFVKSKKSILDDPTQYDSPRYDVHGDLSTPVSSNVSFSLSGMHSIQNGSSSTIAGGIFSFAHAAGEGSDVVSVLNLGTFYRFGRSVIPYAGIEFKNFQVGLSYDINTSSVTTGSTSPQTFEVSFTFRHYNSEIPKERRYHSPF